MNGRMHEREVEEGPYEGRKEEGSVLMEKSMSMSSWSYLRGVVGEEVEE